MVYNELVLSILLYVYRATVLGDHVVSDDASLRSQEEEDKVVEEDRAKDMNLKMSKMEAKEMVDKE